MTEPNAASPTLAPSSGIGAPPSFTDRVRAIGEWARNHKIYIVVAVIAVILSVFWVFTQDVNPGTDDAEVDGHSIVISPRVPGYVEKMNIDDNTVVKTGDLMIQLDPADYQARVDQARAALAVAQARAASLKITVPFTVGTTTSATSAAEAQVAADEADLSRATTTYDRLSVSELKFAEANIAARKAEMDKADMDVKRTQSLAEQSEISHQQYDAYVAVSQVTRNDWIAAQQRLEATKREADAAKAAEDTARASVVRARAEVRESKAQELQSGVRKADYQSALADVQQAQATLDQTLLNLSYTQLRAPMNSMVTKRTVEPGQQFAAGQAMFVLVPLDKIWITANFKETQMAHVRAGQHVTVRVDAYDGKSFDGIVDSIASSTGSREALLPPENATGNFVKVVQRIPVKILVDRNSDSAAVLRPGMNVEAKIRTSAWIF
ncbi:HlyD family secretion protein [Granulicella sp. L60]|uniref:HlyD family secretion protein n=1 Tax=Granulicella sp. L60 TaxID=1641866 RepID=UPI00131CF1AE|nr:HlyD family secretion protein [Granulicella sp. L60]